MTSSEVLQFHFHFILPIHSCFLKQLFISYKYMPPFCPFISLYAEMQKVTYQKVRTGLRLYKTPKPSYQFRFQLVLTVSMAQASVSSLSPCEKVSCSCNACAVCSSSSNVNHFYTSQRFNYTRTITRAEIKILVLTKLLE